MAKGAETRDRILDRAFRLAARDGLEGLSLAALAADAGMSKSGLFAHFRSKEELQIALLQKAAERFNQAVWAPALKAPRGEPRIVRLFEAWLRWADDPNLPGGCPFQAASVELDDHEGRPREVLVASQKEHLNSIAKAVKLAIEAGHFHAGVDPRQFAFDLYGILFVYNHYQRLLGERGAKAHARAAFDALLARARRAS